MLSVKLEKNWLSIKRSLSDKNCMLLIFQCLNIPRSVSLVRSFYRMIISSFDNQHKVECIVKRSGGFEP